MSESSEFISEAQEIIETFSRQLLELEGIGEAHIRHGQELLGKDRGNLRLHEQADAAVAHDGIAGIERVRVGGGVYGHGRVGSGNVRSGRGQSRGCRRIRRLRHG